MGLFRSSTPTFPWKELTTEAQLHDLIEQSVVTPVLLFKHSTRCSISSMAKSRFEKNWTLAEDKCICVYLDLITYRSISNLIESTLKIEHQSPQAILLINKEIVYSASHNGIDANEISELI